MDKNKFAYESGQGITIVKRGNKETSKPTDKAKPEPEQEDRQNKSMPYKVEENVEGCSGFAVVKSDTGELVACHATKVAAIQQVRALYANVPDAIQKAKTSSLVALQQKIQSAEITATSLATHHYITKELGKRGLDLSTEELFSKEVIIDPEVTLDGVELENLFVGEEELVEDIIIQWEENEVDVFKVAFGLWGDGLEILVNPVKQNLEKAESDTFTPPAAVAVEAKRALAWIKEGKAGGGFTDVGRARAAQLAGRRPVSLRTVKRMNSFFSRHEVDKKAEGFSRGEKNYPSAGRVAWDAWGGDAGFSWARGILSSVEKAFDFHEPFMKADDKKFTLGPLYIPNTLDAHSEWTDEEELQTAIWEYVRAGNRNIHLQHNRDVVAGEWVEIMTFPYELSVPMSKASGDTENFTYPKNTVFMGVLWKDWAWDLVKSGKLRGYSIGGKAKRVGSDSPEDEAEKSDPSVNSVHVDTIMRPAKRKVEKAKNIEVGDIVLFATHKEGETTLYSTGQVERIERSGTVTIRGTNESQEATSEDPVAVLRVWAETDNGYQETDRRLAKPFSGLRLTDKDVTKSTEDTLSEKVKEHNEEVGDNKAKRTTTAKLLEVYRRGVGAYNTNPSSVRPNVTGREQWAFGRVNGFLHALKTGRYKRSPYDTDLLPDEHPLARKKDEKE